MAPLKNGRVLKTNTTLEDDPMDFIFRGFETLDQNQKKLISSEVTAIKEVPVEVIGQKLSLNMPMVNRLSVNY